MLTEFVAGIGNHCTGKRSSSVAACYFDGYQLIKSFSIINSFYRPAQPKVTGHQFLHLLHFEISVDAGSIGRIGNTHNRTTTWLAGVVNIQLQYREQWIFLSELFTHFYRIRCCCFFSIKSGFQTVNFIYRSSNFWFFFFCSRFGSIGNSGSSSNCTYSCNSFVCFYQVRIYFRKFVGFPEFEVSWSLEKFTNTFGFFYTRKFDKNTSGIFKLLYIWLYHTETVDTGPEHVEGIIDSAINLCFQYFDNFFICRT